VGVGAGVGGRECLHSLPPTPTRRQQVWLSASDVGGCVGGGFGGGVGGQRVELANVVHILMGGRGDSVARDSELEGIAVSQGVTVSLISEMVKERAMFPLGLVLAYPPIVHGG
jgi:hypothetical protein